MDEQLVIDANVAIKWFLRDAHESEIDNADAILSGLLTGDILVHVPGIFIHEVCGALTKACARRSSSITPRLSKELAIRGIRELFKIPVQTHATTEQDAIEAADLAVTYSKGHYDMTYLRLAMQLNCRWCTADAKFLRAVPSTFPKERVLLLSLL